MATEHRNYDLTPKSMPIVAPYPGKKSLGCKVLGSNPGCVTQSKSPNPLTPSALHFTNEANKLSQVILKIQ